MSSSDMILKKLFCLMLSFHVSWPEAERIFNSVWGVALYTSSTLLLRVQGEGSGLFVGLLGFSFSVLSLNVLY